MIAFYWNKLSISLLLKNNDPSGESMWIKKLFILSILTFFIYSAKLPDLSTQDVKNKTEQILKDHVTYQTLTPELIGRALTNFIEELDPHKTYFFKEEIDKWINPKEEDLKKILSQFNKLDYSEFEKIYSLFVQAIERRNLLEKELVDSKIPKDVDPKKFKDLVWVENREALRSRLLDIKALQLDTVQKFDETTKDQALKILEKRRSNKESEYLTSSLEDKKKLTHSFLLKAISASLDSHTNYFTPTEASQFMIQVQQRLFGIGAQLRDTLNGFTIVRIIEGGPADLTKKLKINDRIIAVDHEPIIGMDIVEGVEKIRGEQDSNVILTIVRDLADQKSETFDITITRNEVVLEESRLKTDFIPYGDGVIGCLRLFSFYQDETTSSTQDMTKAIEALKKDHKIQGILLDLRGNSGGLLPQAVSVAGLFIHQGIVVSIKDSLGKIQHLREVNSKPLYDGPLVILIDKTSASAAEIVAQSLQDYGRAIVVGDKHSFGKGSFQTLTLDAKANGKVNPQGEYKVTRGRYYTVSGKSPQLVGVKSDIEIPGIFSTSDIGEEYGKFPLENDSINPNFEDDLSDIPFLHRFQANKLYKNDPQKKLNGYTQYLPLLTQNSKQRIEGQQSYQKFLEEIKNENYDSESVDFFRNNDPQRTEAVNVIKDLIFLIRTEEKKIAS